MDSRSWFHADRPVARLLAVLGAGLLLASCASHPRPAPAPTPVPTAPKPAAAVPGPPAPPARHDDEIVVAGRRFHTGTTVVTWMDPGGYDAYRRDPPAKSVVKRAPKARTTVKPSPKPAPVPAKPFDVREAPAAGGKSQPLPRGDLAALQQRVDQFVLHYDGSGVSSICFATLRERGLSVHFLLDVDGTIYQTLDLEEKALHATIANDRSIGIEIANVGAYLPTEAKLLDEWYRRGADGRTRVVLPRAVTDPRIRTPGFQARPARDVRVRGMVQGHVLEQYDFTPEQYAALAKLTAALCRVFPRLACDYPRDRGGQVVPHKLADDELARFHGVLGHYHIQTNKQDPGPALQWDQLIEGARARLK